MQVNPIVQTLPSTAGTSKGSATLDRQMFLQLLVTQLKYQDPLNPMDNRELVTQMAQLRSLEQLEVLSDNLELSLMMETVDQSLALLGRKVEYLADDQSRQSGTVQEVRIVGGMPTLMVDGREVVPGDVTAVIAN